MDAALLARVVAAGGFQVVRQKKKAEINFFAVNHNIARMFDGTAGLRFAS